MKGVHDMSLEKIRWKIKGWNIQHKKELCAPVWDVKFVVKYHNDKNSFMNSEFTEAKNYIRYKSCYRGQQEQLLYVFFLESRRKDYVVTTLTFDQFYSFWSINPYRWHCRDLFAYTEDENSKKMFVQFKTKTDLHTYIGWREEVRETYEKQALIEEHSKNTIALLKEVQRDINDTNDKAIEYYEQAVEYLGEDDNE